MLKFRLEKLVIYIYLRLGKLKKEEFMNFDRKFVNEFILLKDSLKAKRKVLIIKTLNSKVNRFFHQSYQPFV